MHWRAYREQRWKDDSHDQKKDECEKLNANLQYQMELDKKRQLRDNISLHGIPSTNGENRTEIILKVLSKIGCETSAANIAKS